MHTYSHKVAAMHLTTGKKLLEVCMAVKKHVIHTCVFVHIHVFTSTLCR